MRGERRGAGSTVVRVPVATIPEASLPGSGSLRKGSRYVR